MYFQGQLKINVFSHLYVPHPPFLFDKNGENISPNHREISGLQSWENEDGYVNQLIYATDQTTMVIDNILQKDPSAIIIIQGDTGTLTGIDHDSEKTFNDVYQSRSILYAIRILGNVDLQEINPVNTYRIIFNHIFNSNYDYLETSNFEINDNGELIDITKKLNLHNFGLYIFMKLLIFFFIIVLVREKKNFYIILIQYL